MQVAPLLAADITWVWSLLGVLSVPLLVALNGFFVAAEFALVAVRKTRVEAMARQGVAGARAVEAAVTNLDRSIAATQLGITLASIALGWVGEPALEHLIDPPFRSLPEAWQGVVTESAAWGLSFFLITFLHVVFGELIPKSVALQTTDRTALWVARPLLWFATATRPIIALMNGTGNAILRLGGFRPAGAEAAIHSVEELSLLVEDTEEAGGLDPEQAQVLQNVFRLSGKRVRDCLVPRERMTALELRTPPDQVLEVVRRSAHTRMPVYEGEPDNVVGVVNTKDLFYLFSQKGVVVLEDALYPPLFLKPDEPVATALRLFRPPPDGRGARRRGEGPGPPHAGGRARRNRGRHRRRARPADAPAVPPRQGPAAQTGGRRAGAARRSVRASRAGRTGRPSSRARRARPLAGGGGQRRGPIPRPAAPCAGRGPACRAGVSRSARAPRPARPLAPRRRRRRPPRATGRPGRPGRRHTAGTDGRARRR
jgi:putative hemolysin